MRWSNCSGHLPRLHVVSYCLLSTTGIHPQQEHHASLCRASTTASSKTFNQKGHSPLPVLHENEAVSSCCASWKPDRQQSRMVHDPLSSDKFCIFRQVNETLGARLHVMFHSRTRIGLSALIINTNIPLSINGLLSPEVNSSPQMNSTGEITAI